MKVNLFPVLFLTLAQIAHAEHYCAVVAEIQVYDSSNFKLKRVEKASTKFFKVTPLPHEEAQALEILDKDGKLVGSASVWTGTVLGSSDGDVIQANASFDVYGIKDSSSLAFSPDTKFAKTTISLEATIGNEFLLMPIDLKCNIK